MQKEIYSGESVIQSVSSSHLQRPQRRSLSAQLSEQVGLHHHDQQGQQKKTPSPNKNLEVGQPGNIRYREDVKIRVVTENNT